MCNIKDQIIRLFKVTLFFCVTATAFADQTIVTVKVKQAPVIDGRANDIVWNKAREIVTHDAVANIDIRLKTVYTDAEIFFLVRFPDSTENRQHKQMIWNNKTKLYNIGPRREDNFVFKWNMEPFPVDISLSSESQYKADIWYWKSYRTNHAGYADDKYQIYSSTSSAKAHRVLSKTGKTFYLTRKGDKGRAAYKNNIPVDFQGDSVASYDLRQPSGSRADVKAKGHWKSGIWTLEFSRKLKTRQVDDVYLTPGLNYRFGVSRYEIAGRVVNPAIEIPLFGSGEISEHLLLQFD